MDYSVERPHAARLWIPSASEECGAIIQALSEAAGGLTLTIGWGHYKAERESVHVVELFWGDEQWKVPAVIQASIDKLLDSGELSVLVERDGKRRLHSRLLGTS